MTMSSQNSSTLYEESLKADEMRILNVLPGLEEEPVFCTLDAVSSADSRAYKALSYVWGDEANLFTISINSVCISVRRNLFDALIVIRNTKSTVQLWVDAVCINQDDLRERNHQVGRMGDIYADAQEVLIWLGTSCSSFTALQDTHDILLNAEGMTADERLSKSSIAREVLVRPWFRRLWVLQQAALARTATLMLGRELCDLDLFCDVNLSNSVAPLVMTANQTNEAKIVEIVEGLLCFQKLMSLRASKSLDPALSWEFLVSDGTLRLCQDPRDHIFGLIGIARRAGYSTQDVDYTLDVRQVFYTFTKSMLAKDRNLLLSFDAGLSMSPKADWPSWIPFLARGTKEFQLAVNRYNAGSTTDFSPVGLTFSDTNLWLVCSGIRFDTVSTHYFPNHNQELSNESRGIRAVVEPYRRTALLAESFWRVSENMESPYKRGSGGLYQACWRTLIGDVYKDSSNLDASQFTLAHDSAQDEVYEYIMRRALFPRELTNDETYTKTKVQAIKNFITSMNAIVHGRSLFVTSGGFIGIGPKSIEAEDTLAVISGMQMPLVVRKRACGTVWDYLGPAYLHGIMQGEALQDKTMADLEEFIIA